MRQLNEQQKLDWKIVTTPGHDQSFRLFVDWQADAFATDDVLLSGFIAKNKANAELAVVRDFLSYDPYGLMCRKGDPSFAAVIERTFARLAEARQIVQLYGKWFLDRLLTGERLGRPITPQLKEILHTIGLPEERGSGGVGPRLAIVAPPGGPPCNQHRLPAAAATAKDEPAMSETLTVATTETIKLDKVETRLEHDLLGETEVPNTACWGVHTKRAVENFPITGVPIGHFPELVKALAMVKQAAARANKKLAFLTRDKAEAIERACELIVQGHHHDQFVVDAIQGGAGTSTNMNANEVIANLALELMGRPKGDYDALHPNNDVNMSQSTNDAYPTALRLAIILASAPLVKALEDFAYALKGKAVEFGDVLKMGRTQLQDAVPMTLGQEFDGFHVTVKEDIARIREIVGLFREVNLGATAIGTGINTDPRYASLAVEELARVSGQPMVLAGNLVEATSDMGAFVLFSGLLKRIAVKLSKICNDLRLLSSGPRTGFGEIRLPPMQAGSSIMPGKVNPVIPEVVNQVAFLVIGHDLTVTLCAEGGQLQLNAFEPTIGFCTLQSMRMLAAGLDTLTKRCIEGIEADVERCRGLAINSIGIITVLNPVLGYDVCSRIAKRALNENRSVLDIVLEEGVLTKEQVTELLRPEKMTQPARATIA